MKSGDLLLLILALSSLLVWEAVRRRWARGQPALDPLPRNESPFLRVAFGPAAIFIALLVVSQLAEFVHFDSTSIPERDASPTSIWQSSRDSVSMILVGLLLLTGAGRVPLADCGIRFQGLLGQLRDGTFAFLASFGPVLLMLIATSFLRTDENQHPFLQLLRKDSSLMTVAGLVVAAVIVAPVKEELLFRVIVQDELSRHIGPGRAIGIVAVLFCFVHGFPDSIALIPLAVILGYLYERRQSMISVVVTHALFNLANLLVTLLPHAEG